MIVYGIIPARSGSKGLINKNIKEIGGKPLIAYSIEFAKKLNLDMIMCSTDSEEYAKIANRYGAEVPFLRNSIASQDTSMEQDILADLIIQFKQYNIVVPDIIVWLRPTFVFRDLSDVKKCISLLIENPEYSAARTVCESEGRLYRIEEGILKPEFDDGGKSMIRRQEIGTRYKVFSTDVIRIKNRTVDDDFLGRNVAAIVTSKICGLDIDDLIDFEIVESILLSKKNLANEYL